MKIATYFIVLLTHLSAAETIVCSNHPIKAIVQEIVGYNSQILTITEFDENIIGYKPSADEIAQSGRSKVFFYSSDFLENWVLDVPSENKIALIDFVPEDKAIYLGDSLQADFWWLDPLTTKIVAEKIVDTLSLIYPEMANNFKGNLNLFSNKLDVLHQYIRSYFGELSFEPIYDEFPVLTYFSESFNLPYADYLYPKYGLPISPNEEFEEGNRIIKSTSYSILFRIYDRRIK